MSTHLPGYQSFFIFFLHHFVLAKLATSSIRVTEIHITEKNSFIGSVLQSATSSSPCFYVSIPDIDKKFQTKISRRHVLVKQFFIYYTSYSLSSESSRGEKAVSVVNHSLPVTCQLWTRAYISNGERLGREPCQDGALHVLSSYTSHSEKMILHFNHRYNFTNFIPNDY